MRTLVYILLALSFNCTVGQSNETSLSSDFVFFKEEKLLRLVENIICEENAHPDKRKKINWYIEFKKNSKFIVITQGRIPNLIELNEGVKKIFTTTINKNIVFILTDKKDNSLFIETGFSIDLSKYKNKSTLSFEDFSSWLLKYNNGVYELKDSHIRKYD